MKILLPVFITLTMVTCKPVQISSDLDGKSAHQLYRQALKEKNDLAIMYNADSAYAVCIEKATAVEFVPVSFVVVDIAGRSEVLTSQNTYLGAIWIDRQILRLEKRIGINLESTDPSKPALNSRYDYFDVGEKEFIVFNNSNKVITKP